MLIIDEGMKLVQLRRRRRRRGWVLGHGQEYLD
jgi:hypothetical protein